MTALACATGDLRADPPPPPAVPAGPRAEVTVAPRPAPPPVARLEMTVAPPPPPPPSVTASVVAPAPRLVWAPAPQPSFGLFSASIDAGGGPMFAPAHTPLSAGGFELGVAGGWGPARFAELRLRASVFDQPDRQLDGNADQQDDVDERNLLGMFLGGGLRLRLPLYAGIDEHKATRFVFFSEGLAGYQPLFGYGDIVSSGPAFEITNGVQIAHVRRRDGLTRGVELFARYRQGFGDGNRDLWALVFGLGYATEWSAYVPAVPEPEPESPPRRAVRWTAPPAVVQGSLEGDGTNEGHGSIEGEGTTVGAAGGEARATFVTEGPVTPRVPPEPLGFSLRMGGECALGEGWHLAKTVGWAPWRFLELQLQTSYFSVDVSQDRLVRDEPNVHGFFGGIGPRIHLYSNEGARLGLWTAAKVGWAQVVAAPEGHDGSGLALTVAVGASIGGTNHPLSTTDASFFLGRQNGLSGNDDDIGMWMAGLAFDYELGPHAPPPRDPVLYEPREPARPSLHGIGRVAHPAPLPPRPPLAEPPAPEPPAEVEVVREPVQVHTEVVRTRTELTLEPARPWPVGFAVGVDVGGSYYPLPLRGGFLPSGLSLGLGVGFVASPYFEVRTRVGLLTRSDAVESGGDDVESLTLTGGPRVRIPIRTVKDHQIALFLEALGGWLSTTDAAGSSLGSSAVLEGAVGVRLPARAGLTLAVRGLYPFADAARDLTSVQLTLGGELEIGPRFGRPVEVPRAPRVEVPERVEMEVSGEVP